MDYTATSLHTIYTSPSLTTVVATAAFQGEFEIEIFHRNTPFETGSFDYQIISQTSSGTIEGKSVKVLLNPAKTSGGTTTITPGPGVGEYTIDTTAIVYSEFIVNGGMPIMLPVTTGGGGARAGDPDAALHVFGRPDLPALAARCVRE